MIVKTNETANKCVPFTILSVLAALTAYIMYQHILMAKVFVLLIAVFAGSRCLSRIVKKKKTNNESEPVNVLTYFLITMFCVCTSLYIDKTNFPMLACIMANALWIMHVNK